MGWVTAVLLGLFVSIFLVTLVRGGNKAFLMIDVQNDFCPGGALAVKNGDEVVVPLNRFVRFIDKGKSGLLSWALRLFSGTWFKFASRDWHPENTTHFAKYGGKWPAHCVQDTLGAEFHKDLLLKDALIISKGMRVEDDAYSPFEGVDPNNRPLDNILKYVGVTDLYIGGLATDYCVKAAVLDALKLGYKTYFLSDASRAVNINSGDGDQAIAEMVAAGAIVTTVDEVINGKH